MPVSVIDTSANSVIATVNIDGRGHGISITSDDKRVYATNEFFATVSIISTLTNTVIDTLNVGGGPMAFGNFIY